ncbi:hypothetical protein LV82_01047 [Albidovulum inexpectatum]|uniref:DoxX-like protein n=1 Tax=Albidovulum inexpectatum TaxID=196587 RepID=A0A2S5JK50_9RHOB|nr:hypothetical protein [Albidovulum inexpectatum]PPB81830.1 hypothetical protein LV82_01047 [Albidovulum inexpectatum]
MSRLTLLALFAISLMIPALAEHVAARRLGNVDVGAFEMAWTAFPILLAAIFAHRRRAALLGVAAFGAQAVFWFWSAMSGHIASLGHGAPDLTVFIVPLVFGLIIVMGSETPPRRTKLRF